MMVSMYNKAECMKDFNIECDSLSVAKGEVFEVRYVGSDYLILVTDFTIPFSKYGDYFKLI